MERIVDERIVTVEDLQNIKGIKLYKDMTVLIDGKYLLMDIDVIEFSNSHVDDNTIYVRYIKNKDVVLAALNKDNICIKFGIKDNRYVSVYVS